MQLIKKLGTKKTGLKIKAKNGKFYDDSRPFGLFFCSFCGKEVEKPIREGKRNKSCGCNRKYEKHCFWKHPLYSVYRDILDRCSNPNNLHYNRYGGRGIKVCESWKNSFLSFKKDMFIGWKQGLSIDRVNNDGDYEPDNCRWTTKTVQARNITRNRKNNTSGYKGVHIDKNCKNKKFVSKIMVSNKTYCLGYFKTAKLAAKAYNDFIDFNNLEHTKNIL